MPPESFTVAEIRAAEKPLLDAGVPLMARAAAALASAIGYVGRETKGDRVLVLAGSGDNGADALYAAAQLPERMRVRVIRTGASVHEQAWTAAMNRPNIDEIPASEVLDAADDAFVIDGMRGIGGTGAGLRGRARDVALELKPHLRDLNSLVWAVDIPSGIDADSGEADESVLPAADTFTFGAMKRGLLLEPARTLAGRVRVVDIGLGLE